MGWKSPQALILRAPLCGAKNTSEMDVAPWCFKWIGFYGLGGAHDPDNPGSV